MFGRKKRDRELQESVERLLSRVEELMVLSRAAINGNTTLARGCAQTTDAVVELRSAIVELRSQDDADWWKRNRDDGTHLE